MNENPRPLAHSVLRLRDLDVSALASLLARYGLTLRRRARQGPPEEPPVGDWDRAARDLATSR